MGGILSTFLKLREQPTPANPPSGVAYVYAKSDGRIYMKGDDNVERQLRPIHVGTTAPASPAVGDLWVNTT